MYIDDETIKYLSNISMINITDEEIKNFKNELTRILNFVQVLDKLDLDKQMLDIQLNYDKVPKIVK